MGEIKKVKLWHTRQFQVVNFSAFIAASINTLVCPLGGLLSATVLDQLGRKLTLVLINIFSIVSWSLIYFSSSTNFDEMYWQIMLGRFLIGEKRLLGFGNCVTFLFVSVGVTIGLSSSPAAGNIFPDISNGNWPLTLSLFLPQQFIQPKFQHRNCVGG